MKTCLFELMDKEYRYKSPEERRMNSDGWVVLVHQPGSTPVDCVIRRYGDERVCVKDTFDPHGNPMPSIKTVYVKCDCESHNR